MDNILITGGTGSFGKKFAKIVLEKYNPLRLVIFSRDELKQYEMRMQGFDTPKIRFFIGDVRDKERLKRAMNGIDTVIHAAALKQVPACEYNPFEAIQTNVMGAQNVIESAIDTGVKKVIAISTDKAVNPVNLYGATKLCAEKLFVQGNSYSGENGTKFSVVRYGNVVGSRGSVVPAFREQKKSHQIYITDRRMTRFWITLEQAVEFVLKCLEEMQGGEIFVPKLPSMKITDLAKVIAPECNIVFTGIRPGEKLDEVLVSLEESRHTVEQEDKYIILPLHPWWKQGVVEGKKMKEGSYTSKNNKHWLIEQDLRRII